ncbi:tyrosine-type recombinase/integrase, partial [Staphylococcus epidermidis]|nr:tyrosine-type recombinase/integrase [Staphylococcus epidermidis]
MKKKIVYQYYVCYTAIELGCRVGEALALKVTDFDFKNQTVKINKSYNQKTDVFGLTKNKEDRIVDFSSQYKKAILNLLL